MKRLIFVMLSFFCGYVTEAQTLTAVEPTLNFGTIALTDNTAQYQLRVRWTGQVINDPQIILVSPPSPAEFQLSGFSPYTPMFISIMASSSDTTKVTGPPSTEEFTISNYDYVPNITTDVNGEATIYLGATMTTSGSNAYTDGIYNLPLTVEVNY